MDWTKITLSGVQLLLLIGIFCPVGIAVFRYFTSSAVQAIFLRNVRSYFSSIIGYLFIIVFVVVAAICSFRPQFFTNNLANLDSLSQFFPMLLLFMIPAITMGTWADERKQGTDELLFTLPVKDVDILLGKYLAVLAVYTITLCFSLTELFVLEYLGDPDWGLLTATYLGYWLAGAMLLSAGMFASALTNNATVAFVLGTIICSIPVFSGKVGSSGSFFESIAESELFQSSLLSWVVSVGAGIGRFFSFLGVGDLAQSLSLQEQLRDFTQGTIPVSGLMYFVLFTLLMLYLNFILIRRRHWGADSSRTMAIHYFVRTLALAAILISLHKMAFLGTARADLTSEGLYTLSPVTTQTIDHIDTKRPVTIQAFLSPQVPSEYVSVRKQIVGLLKQFDPIGGARLTVRFVDVEPYSSEAEVAKHYGIYPQNVVTERDGRLIQEEVFMGLVISSRYDEIVLPFLRSSELIEYELTRSIRTVSKEKRLTIGVLNTDAHLMGGRREWELVQELRKQYIVEAVSSLNPIDEKKYDVLLAVMPSSLTEPEMENLLAWVKHGKPTLIFTDPYPLEFSTALMAPKGERVTGFPIAPQLPKPSQPQRSPFMRPRPSPPKAEGGKLTSLLRLLEIAWQYDEVVWDFSNPHPQYSMSSPENLFITKDSVKDAISSQSHITNGLQEILVGYSGSIKNRKNTTNRFTPLLLTSSNSGLLKGAQFGHVNFINSSSTQRIPVVVENPNRFYLKDEFSHVIAAHIQATNEKKLNVVFVADIDMVSNWFFQRRSSGNSSLKLDNVAFVLNALDVLAGEESFLKLRSRRAKLRKLDRVEAQTIKYTNELFEAKEAADKEAKKERELAQARFDEEKKKIEENKTLNIQERFSQLQTLAETIRRKMKIADDEIQRKKEAEIKDAKMHREQQVRATEDRIRYLAILLPPIPALLLGIIVLFLRVSDERKNIATDRMARK